MKRLALGHEQIDLQAFGAGILAHAAHAVMTLAAREQHFFAAELHADGECDGRREPTRIGDPRSGVACRAEALPERAPCFPSLGPPSPVPGLIGPASANTRARLSRAGGVRCA